MDSGSADFTVVLENDWEDNISSYIVAPGEKLPDKVPDDINKYVSDHFGTQMYPGGTPKYRLGFFNGKFIVTKICPCGEEKCEDHYDGTDTRRPSRPWDEVCTFPKGHGLPGLVRDGVELSILRQRFSNDHYEISEISGKFHVKQKCPCNKTKCDKHVFPAEVRLAASFPLAIYTPATRGAGRITKKGQILLEPLFRKRHAMTFEEVHSFFEQFQLNWSVKVKSDVISFWMICKCKKAFARTPCLACHDKREKKCHKCAKPHRIFKKCHVSVKCGSCKKKQSICSDCEAAQEIPCVLCGKIKRLDHICTIDNQTEQTRKNGAHAGIYPPLLRKKGATHGICQTCKIPVPFRTYARHQKRMHREKSSDDCFTYDFGKVPRCDYCRYENLDATVMREHAKFHSKIKTHTCKEGCGAAFFYQPQERAHRIKAHGKNKRRRVGNLVTLSLPQAV